MGDHATEALADLLGALAHPDRLRLLLRLTEGECDVATLAEAMGLSQPRTSQHLGLLRAHHVVGVQRDGRRHVYSLAHEGLPAWLAEGAAFLVEDAERSKTMVDALRALALGFEGG